MVRNAFKGIFRFSRQLRHAWLEPAHVAASRETAKNLRGAMGLSCSSAYGCGGNSNIDGLLGKELADGHKKAGKKTPPPKAQ